MNNILTKKKVVYSLKWKFLQNSIVQVLTFIITIILARLLTPNAYGIIALTTVFLKICNALVINGFNSSLIQKKNIDKTDLSSVFFLSLIIATLLYIIIFIASPFISNFYTEPQLSVVLRVLGLSLFPGAIISIQNAIISRKLLFKKLFYSSLYSVLISGIIGVFMAFKGYGVWSLVVQQLLSQFITMTYLFIFLDWNPKLLFSKERVLELFSFGSKILASSLIDTIYNELRSLFIGKVYSSSTLGFYNRGRIIPRQIITSINGSIQSVLFPTLSAHQDDVSMIKRMVRKSIITSTFIVFPLMLGIAVVARPLVSILLTDKWLESVRYIQIFCISYALWPIHTTNLQAIKAIGKSNTYLKIEVIKKIVGLTILIITIPLGIEYIALGVPLTGFIAIIINTYPNKRYLEYSTIDQIKDMLPSLILSIVMSVSIYFIPSIGLSDIYTLIMQFSVGLCIYFGLAIIFQLEALSYTIEALYLALQRFKNNSS